MDASEDTPRSAFAIFSWRINLAVVVCLLAVSLVAWLRTVEDARSMSGMVMGLGQIGSRPQGDMGVTLFLVMWTVMMVAMMLPTVAPMVLAHLSSRNAAAALFPRSCSWPDTWPSGRLAASCRISPR